MMGTMVECAQIGPASCWMVSPVVGNPPKILSAGGGWGRINPPPVGQWHPPTPLSRPPLLDVHPTGPPVRPHPQFRA